MYEKHWGLEFPPFDESHSAESFVESKNLKLARAKLHHVISQGQGAAAVIGPAGIGKTAMAKQLLKEFEGEGWATSFISTPVGKPDDILLTIAYDLGGSGETPIEALQDAAWELGQEGRRACIIIDEAHTITRLDLLEDLRMLLNLEVEGQAKLALILIGQESLPELLRAASGFDQRLALIVRLREMSPETSKRYILTRLKRAGCSRGLFSKSAANRIEELSSGVPRDINRICELSLTVGFGFGLEKISREVVNNVARDLGLLREEKPHPKPLKVKEASRQQLDRDLVLALNTTSGSDDVMSQRGLDLSSGDNLDQVPPEGLHLISPTEVLSIDSEVPEGFPLPTPASAPGQPELSPPDVADGSGLFSSLARATGLPAIRTGDSDVLSSMTIMEESFMPPPVEELKSREEPSGARLLQAQPEPIFPRENDFKSETDILASTEDEDANDILSATSAEITNPLPPPEASVLSADADDADDVLAGL